MQDRKKVAQLIRDLGEIKAAVKRNNPMLREIVSSRFYWWVVLIYGVAMIVFSVALQLISDRFGGYTAIPGRVRTVFWIIAAVVTLGAYMYRVSGVLRTIRRIDPRLTLWSLFGDHNIGEFFHLTGPLMLIAAALTVYLAKSGHPFYIVGTWGLCLGLIENQLAFTVHLNEYYVIGYWFLVTAALSFFFPGLSAAYWTAICFGGGSMSYVAASAVIKRGDRARTDADE